MIGDFLDGPSEGQGVNMAVCDYRKEREIRGDAGGVGRPRNRFQCLCRKCEPLLLKGPRPQPPCTEVARE